MTANPVTGQTLIDAIKREIEGRAFYLALAERVKNPLVRRKLLGLAEDELQHRETLSRLYWAQTGTEVGDFADFDPTPDLPDMDDLSLVELLELAMKAEKEAAENYLAMSQQVEDPRAAGFLEYLSDFENGHYETLAAELERVKKSPGWEDQGIG